MAKDDTEEKPKKKRSKLKLLLILLFVLALLGGAAAGAWFFFLADMFQGSEGGGPTTVVSEQAQTQQGAQPIGTTVPLPVFTVNLADPLGQRFIKISLEVEVSDPKVAGEMDAQKARIRDSIIMLLSSKSYADIATTESKIMLKSEITARLAGILGQGKVYQVFITDMVIQ
jgi:flagellar FliL protein